MKTLIAAVAATLLIACSSSEATTTPEEPWLVTGMNMTFPVSERMTIGVEYTAPGGRIGRWELSMDAATLQASPLFKCWTTSVIGEPLPECVRTNGAQPR
jgi:hypothetical protein